MQRNDWEFQFERLPKLGSLPLPIYQEAVNEVVRVHKVPSKLAHYSALGAAGALAQMHVDVQMPFGGKVPTGLYILLQGKIGERKTTVDGCFFSALRQSTESQRAQHKEAIEADKIREGIWKRKTNVLNKALDKAFRDGKDTAEIETKIIRNNNDRPRSTAVKLVFNDVTIEALRNKLNQSPNATMVSSEGKKLLKNLLQNDADINSLWSGEEIDVERVSVPSYKLTEVRLTFSVMIQSEVLTRIMLDKGKEGLETGFFSRVIFSDVGSTQGDRLIDIFDAGVPNLDAFNQRIAALVTEYCNAIAGGKYRRKLLKFNAEASRVWVAYFNYVESNKKNGGRYEKDIGHASKLPDNVARVAGALHVLEGFDGELGMDCLLAAIALCDQASQDYMQHLVPKDKDEIEATALKDWLVKKYVKKNANWVEVKRIVQFGPNRMRTAPMIRRYLEILERGDYLTIWLPGTAGRKAETIELHMNGLGEPRSTHSSHQSWRLPQKAGS